MMKLQKFTFLVFLVTAMVAVSSISRAENEGDDLNVIELELEKSAPKKVAPVDNPAAAHDNAPQNNTLSDFSGLGKLAPFSEVSVIQKRYLPKTGRFQLFLGPTLLTNNAFYNTYGLNAKFGYFFTETWGIELTDMMLSTTSRDATKDLQNNTQISATNLVSPKSYLGVDAMYSPIYGKFSRFNRSIVPFDMYFSAGYGTTGTKEGPSAGGFHVGTGQIWAINKAWAFRWDFSWNFYSVKPPSATATSSFNNLFLTVGASWFFPEAKYR